MKKGKHEHLHGLGPKRVIEINGIGVQKRRPVWIRKLDLWREALGDLKVLRRKDDCQSEVAP